MPITLNGNGTITGIATGGISDSKAVSAEALGAGSIKQVINSLNSYPHTLAGVQNTEYTVQSASSTDWETSITINQGNKIHATISLMLAKEGTDANAYYDLYFNVDGGSFSKAAQGDSTGSRSRHLANCRSYGGTYNIEESTAQVLITPTLAQSTGIVKFQCRVTQRAGGSARPVRVNETQQNDAEGASVVSSLTLIEVVA